MAYIIMQRFLVLLIAILSAATTPTAMADTSETVYILSDDLKFATKYYNKRADYRGNNSFLFEKDFPTDLILYARPENYAWQNWQVDAKQFKKLSFPNSQGYAYLQRQPTQGSLTKTGASSYLLGIDGSECLGDGCVMDENIIAVVVPRRFKVKNYWSLVNGNWKVVDNTYTFYARNVKGASVFITF